MAALIFDTHRAVKNLEEAGFEESQAEAVVDMVGSAVGENVATSSDLRAFSDSTTIRLDGFEQRIESRLDAFEQHIESRMDAFEQRIESRLDGFEQRMDAFEQRMMANFLASEERNRAEIKSLEHRMTIKLGAMVFAGTGVIIAVMAIMS